MASVTLDRMWVHDATDLDTYLTFYTSDRSEDRTLAGTVRTYANGRQRIITSTGSSRTLPVTFPLVTSSELTQLEAWRGTMLMFRDHRGRLFFGTFFGLSITDHNDRSGYSVTLTITEASSSLPEV